MKHRFTFIVIIVLALFFRLYGLNWDQGHYLHPDERLYVNASGLSWPASLAEFLSPKSPLNPKMFYYGSFPLYFYKLIHSLFFPAESFLLTSRLVSALVSFITIPLIYLIAKNLFSKHIGLLAALIFAFTPGIIQHAHFNTTETFLVFFLTAITLVSILALKLKQYQLFSLAGILVGLAYATKIVGLTFISIPILAGLMLYLKDKNGMKLVLAFVLCFGLVGVTGIVAAPYQIIDFPKFQQEQEYMQGVTYGKYKPVFVIIYENTSRYLYPMMRILPFTFGFLAFPLTLVGFLLLIKRFIKTFSFKNSPELLLILLYPLIYFLWAGSWYAKFSRYFIIIFPFLAIWAAWLVARLPKVVQALLTTVIIINGLLFLRIYIKPHTRIQGSIWLYQHAAKGASIAGEHWDDNLPLPLAGYDSSVFQTISLPVYDTPDDAEKIARLVKLLSTSDYFAITSRRVYYSIVKNPKLYPNTSRFYKLLFAGKLGFETSATFTNYPYIASDDFADETFQSYDHPPVVIFKNVQKLSPDQLSKTITIAKNL